jgi:glycosyltransferase involved in cell wall biosynthesis
LGKRKSVVIIGTRGYPSYYGGFETAVRKLAPYLAAKGWDVTVYGRPGLSSTHSIEVDQRVHRKVTVGLETKSLSTLSYGLSSVVDAVRRKPDVAVVMNVANGYWLPMLKARGIPTLVNVDGIEWDRAKWGRLAKAVFYGGARMTARYGRTLVYDSTSIASRWKREFGRAGVFIPYGAQFPGELAVVDELPHRGYILVVARFVPENTIPEFFEAARSLANKWPIVIVGSSGYGGELDEEVQRLASTSPNVKWLGHVSDDNKLFSLWQHAGVYFHGHSVGGTNPALVQAMAAGAPIVARDTVYNREVLNDAASFVEPTASAITVAITDLMQDPRRGEAQIEANLRRAREVYTWEAVCAAYEQSLLDLIDERTSKTRTLGKK